MSVACDCEVSFRHLFLAGEALACVCWSKLLSAIKHLKTLVPSLILVPAKQHTQFADPLCISWGAVPPEAAFSCPFMWMHLDYSQDRKYSEVC